MTGWNYLVGKTPHRVLNVQEPGICYPALERRRRRRVFLSAFIISKTPRSYLTLSPHFVPVKPIISLHFAYENDIFRKFCCFF
jgi:hypothetical protein